MRYLGLLAILLVALPTVGGTTELQDLYVRDLDDTEINIRTFQGTNLLIMGMTTTCSSCKIQNDYLKEIDNATDELVIVSIAMDDQTDNLKTVTAYIENYDISWEIYIDETGAFSLTYHVSDYPNLLLFDSSGALVQRWRGVTPTTTLVEEINPLLENPIHPEKNTLLMENLLDNNLFQVFLGTLFITSFAFIIIRIRK